MVIRDGNSMDLMEVFFYLQIYIYYEY